MAAYNQLGRLLHLYILSHADHITAHDVHHIGRLLGLLHGPGAAEPMQRLHGSAEQELSLFHLFLEGRCHLSGHEEAG